MKERLLFIGMITLADDEGRLRGDARYLKSQIFPYDNLSISKVEKMRDHIRVIGLIDFYVVDNLQIISHPSWYKYQILDRRRSKPSDFPAPFHQNTQTNARQEQAQDKVTEAEEEEEINTNKNNLGSHPTSAHAKLMLDAMNTVVGKKSDI